MNDKLSLKLEVVEDRVAFFLFINGKQVQNEYNTNVTAFFSHFGINSNNQKEEFKGFYVTDSDFYPLNCSCGSAGCNGIHRGVYQKNKKYSVEWRVEPKYYSNYLPKKFYSFPVTNYRYEVLKVWFWLIDTLANPVGLSEYVVDDLQRIVETMKDYYPEQYNKLMASREEYEHYLKVNEMFTNIRRHRKV